MGFKNIQKIIDNAPTKGSTNLITSGAVESINSLFLRQSTTQLIKLTDIDKTINGLHITIKNNHVTVQGTATASIYNYISVDEAITQFEAGVNYVASVQNVVDNTPGVNDYFGMFLWIAADNGDSKTIQIINGDSVVNINATTNKKFQLAWNIQPGTYDKEFDFMIEYGTIATQFEPYYVVGSVANNSITHDKLADDVRETLNLINTELTGKADASALPSAELLGKSIYSDGDSIADGSVTNKISYAHLIANKYGMTLTSKAVGNTTLAIRDGQVSSILGRVLNMTGGYDYILLDGGTNDVTYDVPLGEITEGTNVTFNEETRKTLLGALEEICQFLNTNYCKAKKLFIFPNARVDGTFTETQETFSKMKEVLKKWGIPYIDIGTITSLGLWNDEIKSEYFVDSIHPNLKAYEDFYVPYIEKALLYGGYINT